MIVKLGLLKNYEIYFLQIIKYPVCGMPIDYKGVIKNIFESCYSKLLEKLRVKKLKLKYFDIQLNLHLNFYQRVWDSTLSPYASLPLDVCTRPSRCIDNKMTYLLKSYFFSSKYTQDPAGHLCRIVYSRYSSCVGYIYSGILICLSCCSYVSLSVAVIKYSL